MLTLPYIKINNPPLNLLVDEEETKSFINPKINKLDF